MNDATTILKAMESGDAKSAEQLLCLVYHDLRRLAAFKMSQQAPGQTLQPTALVHEAWLRLVGGEHVSFQDRNYFFSAAAAAMRHILIDRARRKQTLRHGGGFEQVHVEDFELAAPSPDDVVFYREETQVPLGKLEQIGSEIQQIYRQMGTSEHFTPHTRNDVDWLQLMPE